MSPDDPNAEIISEFRDANGRVQGFGRHLVLLHHVGAKTGTQRVSPVMAIRPPGDEDTWWIAASKGGAPEHPQWLHNLVAAPETVIETPDGRVDVHARVLDAHEREVAWPHFTEKSDGFRQYQDQTERVIPVVELTRR